MLRELQVTNDKPANSMYKSGEEKIVTGMAVVKNETNKTFEFASAETAADLFFVDKERVPSGINAARGDMSDYDEDFTTLKENEFGKLIAYYVGERFAVDQYVESGLEEGVRVSANTDGKLIKATSTVTSKYVFKKFYDDNGHKLAIIEVSDTPTKNS
ncbi:hypothetical protein FYJ37_00910 [[Clostridium] scindens]|uniref:Uncharacterized protein n=1 Tax=Clostridium scindens (strain JCM 10418 / VPI 12708) TaxID=29347 RepID=A0A844F9U3_CLOSV|nr:hypothetical protein [[Clostridium] scindens]MSS38944.1 hypothetical protein [[Clostridium] scindens]